MSLGRTKKSGLLLCPRTMILRIPAASSLRPGAGSSGTKSPHALIPVVVS